MPGRKSNVSTTSNGPEEVADSTPARQTKEKEREKDGLSVDDLSLPKSMIARLAKGVLPANTQIHKDALLALHKSATVFVSYIASNSNDNAIGSGKKTMAPQDVIAALKDAELESFLPRLEAELKKYNEVQCEKRNTYRKKVKEEKAAAEATQTGESADAAQAGEGARAETTNGAANGHAETDDADRPAKKLKGENGHALPPDAEDVDDEEGGDEQDADENEDDADEEMAEDEVDDEEEGPQDQTMEDDDADEHFDDARSEISRDSALDDGDSD